MIATSEDKEFTLDKYNDDDLLSTLLRYGLFIGAIFQLVCIASSILLPGNESCADNDGAAGGGGDTTTSATGNRCCPNGESALSNVRRLHKLRKQEKKKRR